MRSAAENHQTVAESGPREFGFVVYTYDGARALHHHLGRLADGLPTVAATVVVAGAGLTGIELACELPTRLPWRGAPACGPAR